MPAGAFGTPSLLLQRASRWRINFGSTLVAFVDGGVGHSNHWRPCMNDKARAGSPATFYCGVVALLWVALGLHLCITAVFHGRHPESLHGFWIACAVTTIFGSPVALFYGWISTRSEKNPRLRKGMMAAAVLFVFAIINWPLAVYISSP